MSVLRSFMVAFLRWETPPIDAILGGFPTKKARPEKIRRKRSLYGSTPMKASRTMTKPTTLSTLQCASSFDGSGPFSANAASTISSTLDDLQLDIALWIHERIYESSSS